MEGEVALRRLRVEHATARRIHDFTDPTTPHHVARFARAGTCEHYAQAMRSFLRHGGTNFDSKFHALIGSIHDSHGSTAHLSGMLSASCIAQTYYVSMHAQRPLCDAVDGTVDR